MTNKENKKKKVEIKIAEAKTSSKKNVEQEKRIGTRGRTFEGVVTKKFHKRIVIEFERMIYVRKYERYAKSRTKIHARLPDNMEKEVNIGDLVRLQECRPLSKIIHFMVIKKIKSKDEIK